MGEEWEHSVWRTYDASEMVELQQEYPSCIATATQIVRPDIIYKKCAVSFDGSNISDTETEHNFGRSNSPTSIQ